MPSPAISHAKTLCPARENCSVTTLPSPDAAPVTTTFNLFLIGHSLLIRTALTCSPTRRGRAMAFGNNCSFLLFARIDSASRRSVQVLDQQCHIENRPVCRRPDSGRIRRQVAALKQPRGD